MAPHIVGSHGKKERSIQVVSCKYFAKIRNTGFGASEGININTQADFHGFIVSGYTSCGRPMPHSPVLTASFRKKSRVSSTDCSISISGVQFKKRPALLMLGFLC